MKILDSLVNIIRRKTQGRGFPSVVNYPEIIVLIWVTLGRDERRATVHISNTKFTPCTKLWEHNMISWCSNYSRLYSTRVTNFQKSSSRTCYVRCKWVLLLSSSKRIEACVVRKILDQLLLRWYAWIIERILVCRVFHGLLQLQNFFCLRQLNAQ